MHDIIYIHDLTLIMSIGVFDHEKTTPQRVIVNAELHVNAGEYDDNDLGSTVCYDTVTQEIKAASQDKHYHLAEVFAEDIAALCLKNTRVQSVRIDVQKPDIMGNGVRVGVKITRTR